MKHTSGERPVFEIAEWETLQIDGEVLTPSDQRLKEELESGEEGRLLVDELRTGVRVTARSWVGIVRFERFEVRVVPKLAGDNIGLVEMIEFATGLDSLRRSSSARSLHAEGTGLFDLIALLLAEGTELILRGGLLADYVESARASVADPRWFGYERRAPHRRDKLFRLPDRHEPAVRDVCFPSR